MTKAVDQVDIEAIIEGIKEEIGEKYTRQEMLAFEPVDYSSSLVYLNPSLGYDELYLEDKLTACSLEKQVEWDRDVRGGSVSSKVKKTIKRLTRFFIGPIVHDQNRFNFDVVDVLMQMKFRIELLEESNESLQRQIDVLKDVR